MKVTTVRAWALMKTATAAKIVAYRTGLHRQLFYKYNYMFSPADLATLVDCLTQTHDLPEPILEIGCAAGNTTVFLNKHVDELGDKRRYYCLDTFAGFMPEDIAVEVGRGKDADHYKHVFKSYRKKWFDQTMVNNNVWRVESIQADVNTYDFGRFDQISFCLIDVDLMRPVIRSLEEVLPRMAPGGLIAVDDCAPSNRWDGALAGYTEFVEQQGLEPDIRNNMLGMIQVPRDVASDLPTC